MPFFNKLLLPLFAVSLFAQTKDVSPRYIGAFTVATLPAAASWSGYIAVTTDASVAGSCTVGGGSAIALCRSSGAAWVSLGGASAPVAGTCILVAGSTVSLDTACAPDLAAVQAQAFRTGTDAGGDDTYVAVLSPVLAAYTAGQCFSLIVATTNTGAATAEFVSGSAKTIKTLAGGTLVDGDMKVGAANQMCYDGTDFRLQAGVTVSGAAPYIYIAGLPYLPYGFAATVPPTTGWTAQGFSTATFTTTGLGGILSILSTATLGQIQSQKRALGGTTILTAMVNTWSIGAANNSYCGIGLYDSVGGTFQTLAIENTSAQIVIRESNWTNATTINYDGNFGWGTPAVYLQMEISGANTIMRVSLDGKKWTQVRSINVGTFTDWIFTAGGNGAAIECQLLSWNVA